MKRYRFRMESVLRVRRVQEGVAASHLRLANASAAAAAAHVDESRRVLAAMPAPRERASTREFRAQMNVRVAAAASVLSAQSTYQTATAMVAVEAGRWRAASQRVSILERVDDARRAEHELELRREEEALVDDLVTGAYRRRDREVSP
jgi:hypothetical protein